MGGFWNALGAGLAEYGKNRLQHGLGGQIINAIHPPQQNTPGIGELNRDPSRVDPNGNVDLGGVPDPMPVPQTDVTAPPEAMAGGKLVTKPTLAMVGEHGPEAVVPLTDQPGAKTTPAILGGAPRTRWQRPSGPVASHHQAPIRGIIPIRPNNSFR